jgi:hypothetical protein
MNPQQMQYQQQPYQQQPYQQQAPPPQQQQQQQQQGNWKDQLNLPVRDERYRTEVRSRCRPVAFPDHRPPRRSRAGAPTERAAPTEARAWEHARARASTRRPTSRRADAAVDAIDRPRHARRAIRITTTRDIRHFPRLRDAFLTRLGVF